MPGSQVLEQAGDILGQAGQPPQHANQNAGSGCDRNPPPMPREPAETGIGGPPRPELDYPQENEGCQRSEHPEYRGITHERPELAPLGKRRIGGRLGPFAHKRHASKTTRPAHLRRRSCA